MPCTLTPSGSMLADRPWASRAKLELPNRSLDACVARHQSKPRRSLVWWGRIGLAVLLAASLGTGAASDEIQDLDAIRQAVESFVATQTPPGPGTRTIEVDNLDSRLRLQACTAGMQTSFPPGGRSGGNRTVGVSCPGPKPWTIYVSVRISYRGDVLVAARSLPRGSAVGASDLVVQERDLQGGPFGYLTQTEQAVGMRTTRAVRAGMPIAEGILEEVPVVTRGQKVWMVAESANLKVRMVGTALQDGAVGDRVRVENASSKKVVEGIVAQNGIVRISL
jgi:flagella basal body P-ring formation protein FlgA